MSFRPALWLQSRGHEIMPAETRKAAQQAIAQFEADYGAKYPKAVASLRRDESELLYS